MAILRLAGLAAVAAILGLAAPLSGQIDRDYEWTPDRPDGVAPVGIDTDRTYASGEFSFFYRFSASVFEGLRSGQATVPLAQATDLYFLVPIRQERMTHRFGAAWGLNDRVTLELGVPFLVSSVLDQTTADGNLFSTDAGITGDADRFGLGDVEAYGHLSVYEEGSYRAHATLGVSAPVGTIEESQTTPLGESLAPYAMQTGSGTWDLLPGFTFFAMNERASTGFQVSSALRLHDNPRDYNLGQRFQGEVWGAYRATELLSVSGGARAVHSTGIEGADPALNPNLTPLADPTFQGGTRVELPLGLNVLFEEGLLEDHRFGLEASFPVHQDLEGLQLEHEWTVTAGWEYALPVL